MRKRLALLLVTLLCVMASVAAPGVALAADGDGTPKTDMPTGQRMFITLVGHNDRRWNADGTAGKRAYIHLDNAGGSNCSFRLYKISDDGWYAIKHIKDGGTSRYVDVKDEGRSAGSPLHLWESADTNMLKKQNGHFAFYYEGDDEYGNAMYSIKNRYSDKWVGTAGGATHEDTNIVLSDEKVLWYVTPSTYPLDHGADELVGDEYDHSLVQIFRQGTDEEVNKKADVNEEIHFYHLGSTNKWRLEYVPQYGAYRVAYATGGESLPGECWNVSGESGKTDSVINIRSPQEFDGNEHTSQLWRIWKRDGGYVFQNLRSGLYVHAQSDSDLRTDAEYTAMDLSIIDARYDNASYRINYKYANPWMKDIPDNALLSSVNIPGTHDTGTADISWDLAKSISMTTTQYLYYQEQLNVGARSFDIRCDAGGEGTTADEVRIVHGGSGNKCNNRDGSALTLGDIFTASKRFLDQYPSETIILTIKPDAGSTKGLEDAVETFVKENKDHVYCGGGIPSMGEARGKIVILRRFPRTDATSDQQLENGMGLDLSNWDDFNYRDYHAFAKIYDQDDTQVYVQDAYDVSGDDKRGYIEDAMKQTTSREVNGRGWVFNYTSCANGSLNPLTETRKINPWLFDDSMGLIDNRFLGQVMLNYVEEPLARLIYETNFAEGREFQMKGSVRPHPQIPDVDYSAWYASGITFSEEQGLMTGYADGTFGVGKPLTRAQLATILWRNAEPDVATAYDKDTTENATGIADVASHEWYTGAANWAVANGVIHGYANADGTRSFAPDDPVTTEQLVTIIANYRGGDAVAEADLAQLEGLTDGAEVSEWARQSVAWAKATGLVNGYANEDGTRTLRPQEEVPRERAANILMNAFSLGILVRADTTSA